MSDEATMTAALKPFGWTCTPDFWQRYYTDPWVFNLANAVERLTAENARLRESREEVFDEFKRVNAEKKRLTAQNAHQTAALQIRATQAWLGLATTRELLLEIKARGECEMYYREEGDAMAIGAANVIDMLPGSMLDYRTVYDVAAAVTESEQPS